MSPSRHTRYQAVILRDDDAILLVRCVFADGRDWWMLPGGGREGDETEEECVAREVREETTLGVRAERVLRDAPSDPPDGMYVRHRTYLCRVVDGTASPGGGEGPDASLVDVMWLPLFDDRAWPAEIRHDRLLSPQLHAFRAELTPVVSAVLFDLDDTLLDRRASVEHHLARHATRVEFTPDVAEAYRARFWELDGAGYTPRATVFDQLTAEFPSAGASRELVADWQAHAFDDCVFIDGAREVLAWCRAKGVRTGIITNGPSAMQRAKLEHLGLVPLVDVVIVSGEEGIHKPDAELFYRAAARVGVSANACVFIGDHPQNDVAGASGAGMHAVWFARELAWPRALPKHAHAIRELTDLPRILRIAPLGG